MLLTHNTNNDYLIFLELIKNKDQVSISFVFPETHTMSDTVGIPYNCLLSYSY